MSREKKLNSSQDDKKLPTGSKGGNPGNRIRCSQAFFLTLISKISTEDESQLITRILVPLDGSVHAEKALMWALDLAEKYRASVELLTVVPLLETFVTGVYAKSGKVPLFGPTPKELQERAEIMLKDELNKAKEKSPHLKISTRVLEGKPSEKIVEAAKEGSYDLIVMGSRGLGGVKEFFLGSVADRVACESKITVTIVK